jgi:cell division protein FtsQ
VTDRKPGSDVPSAEVLDELLRAFSADTEDARRLEQIDLESPAVQELLSPEPDPQPQQESEVESSVPGSTPVPIVIDATDEPADPTPPSTPEGTIFIDDRLTGETVPLEAATATGAVEPRFRERRIAVRRAAGRKRLRWVVAGLAVLLVVVAALAVLGSSLFAVDSVEVEGAVYTDEARLAAVVDDLEGTPVLRVDTDAAERELEAIPWVEHAVVHTDFPHGAKIEIRERTPVATFEGPDGRWRVIDDDGRVLDVLDSQPVDYLLVLSADPPSSTAGQFAPQGFGAAASLVQALTPELRARAQSVSVTPDGSDLRLLLDDGLEVRFGAAQDLVAKLVRLQTRLDQLEGAAFSYVDVSTNEVTTG